MTPALFIENIFVFPFKIKLVVPHSLFNFNVFTILMKNKFFVGMLHSKVEIQTNSYKKRGNLSIKFLHLFETKHF